jgi:hypothetical protein
MLDAQVEEVEEKEAGAAVEAKEEEAEGERRRAAGTAAAVGPAVAPDAATGGGRPTDRPTAHPMVRVGWRDSCGGRQIGSVGGPYWVSSIGVVVDHTACHGCHSGLHVKTTPVYFCNIRL